MSVIPTCVLANFRSQARQEGNYQLVIALDRLIADQTEAFLRVLMREITKRPLPLVTIAKLVLEFAKGEATLL